MRRDCQVTVADVVDAHRPVLGDGRPQALPGIGGAATVERIVLGGRFMR